MNTTYSRSSEHSWSRRTSTESVYSIQGRETDIVRDTSDTSWSEDERDTEYEPVTESEVDAPVSCDSSGGSDNEIIATKVIEVSIRDDGDMVFADSEQTESNGSDSEIDLHDYWNCAQCLSANNNPLYRYCEKCFKVRKNFFPPRPKRKPKRASSERECQQIGENPVIKLTSEVLSRLGEATEESITPLEQAQSGSRILSQDTAYESLSSQELVILPPNNRKRRSESFDTPNKKMKLDTMSEGESDNEIVQPLVKMTSDPLLMLEDSHDNPQSQSMGESKANDDMCIICLSRPKSGAFVHGRIAHICCCYNCALKVWTTSKRCPGCNCKVSNILKAVKM